MQEILEAQLANHRQQLESIRAQAAGLRQALREAEAQALALTGAIAALEEVHRQSSQGADSAI